MKRKAVFKRIRPDYRHVCLLLAKRLEKIAEIIEAVEIRCMATDGRISEIHEMIRPAEFRKIYRLAKGRR